MTRRAAHLALSAVLLSGVAAACGDDDATGTAGTTTTATTATTAPTTSTSSATTAPPGDDPTPTTVPPTSAPGDDTSPAAVAAQVVAAWAAGDDDTVRAHAAAGAADLLTALGPGAEPWAPGACEGTAGSTYCPFTTPGAHLRMRVAHPGPTGADAPTVSEVQLVATGEAVALWPLTTAEQARNTQAEVDGGSSPWHLEPEAVVLAYAEAVLGYGSPAVDRGASEGETTRVVAGDGRAADVAVRQPARTGPGGIWAVVAVVNAPV